MFTGIVTDVGTVESVSPLKEGIKLRVATKYDPTTIDMGASISHAGVCLTVTGLPQEGSNGRWFEVEAWEEALRLTTIGTWEAGAKINLERSLKIALARGDKHIGAEHITLAALQPAVGTVPRALACAGVDRAGLISALSA